MCTDTVSSSGPVQKHGSEGRRANRVLPCTRSPATKANKRCSSSTSASAPASASVTAPAACSAALPRLCCPRATAAAASAGERRKSSKLRSPASAAAACAATAAAASEAPLTLLPVPFARRTLPAAVGAASRSACCAGGSAAAMPRCGLRFSCIPGHMCACRASQMRSTPEDSPLLRSLPAVFGTPAPGPGAPSSSAGCAGT